MEPRTAPTLYEALAAAGCHTDHRPDCSDLFFRATPEAVAILERFPVQKDNAQRFTVQDGHPDAGQLWVEVPFAYTPFWDKVRSRSAG